MYSIYIFKSIHTHKLYLCQNTSTSTFQRVPSLNPKDGKLTPLGTIWHPLEGPGTWMLILGLQEPKRKTESSLGLRTRPARPARWLAEAFEQGTTIKDLGVSASWVMAWWVMVAYGGW